MVTHQKQKRVRLSECASQIWNGDLLLFRGSGLLARLIGTAGRSPYTHAARAIWWGDTLFCCEVRELKGGRAVTLASQVRKFPGRIDVFATNPDNRWAEYDRHGAIQHMLQLTGCDYGYRGLLEAALLHVPLWRVFMRPATEDSHVVKRPPFCSEACAMADRIGGHVDPVPHLADRITEPADLARSSFYRYRFTLRGV